jgi:hypothetical protein
MLTLGQIAFLSPYALFALAVIPVIWWLLRFTPPKPDRVKFPPFRFLLGLVSREETPHKSPWWLTALRTLIAAMVIIAAANPVLNPHEDVSRQTGPLVIVADDGWAAARDWERRAEILRRVAQESEGRGRQIAFVQTSPRADTEELQFLDASEFALQIDTVRPQPFAATRLDLSDELATLLDGTDAPEVIWLSDGLDYGDADEFADALSTLGTDGADSVAVYRPAAVDELVILGQPTSAEGVITLPLTRPQAGAETAGTVRALALNGRSLGDATFAFAADATETTAEFELPVALRNQVARIEVVGGGNAAGVFLLDDRWRRKAVGVVTGVNQELAQPLLSPLYYLERALEPFADVRTATASDTATEIQGLLGQGLSALVLADIGHILANDLTALEEWLENGGILIRFAGPRLAGGSDQLVPVGLRRGDRALGGALSWSQPQVLSPFESDSPFFGLEVSSEVSVNRQVLAEPSAELSERTWARLADGTPLVTAAPSGNGLIVLFHVPANPEWSNLPISGLFVEMLQRIVDLAQGVAAGDAVNAASVTLTLTAYTPTRTLNGYGEMTDPPPAAAPIAASDIAETVPSPQHPPGLYRRGAHMYALNVADGTIDVEPMPNLGLGIDERGYQSEPQEPLRGILFLIALILLLIDGLAVLALSGRLARPVVTATSAALLLAVALTGLPGVARAQEIPQGLSAEDEFALRASLETRLGYVLTGNSTVDQVSLAGLTGLSTVLLERTALEPGGPIGLNIDSDDIVFFPLIYWPVLSDAEALSEQTAAKIDAYLKNGGSIFFDTRDHQISLPNISPDEVSETQQALRRILSRLDIPPLETVPADHVLTKAFYLLQDFPGRWEGGQLWVEASLADTEDRERRGSSNFDGVSSIIIGSNDYAGAWAIDLSGQALYPVVPGGARQREMSYRSGVNIVMYALTGNYKADQVHVPALLERLGQ